MTGRKVKVLIVDDSAVVRQTLEQLLASDPDIEVIGSAADPFIAAERMKDIVPGRHHAGRGNAAHGRIDFFTKNHDPAPHPRGDLLISGPGTFTDRAQGVGIRCGGNYRQAEARHAPLF